MIMPLRATLTGMAAALLLLAAAAARADQCAPARGQVGGYDYLLLSLSWAPSFCATPAGRNNPQECGPGAAYGFVVHGLWPQYADGKWPQCCQAVPPLAPSPTIDKASQWMIGDSLRDHEWEKHGSCVTGRQDEYFGTINRLVDTLGLAPALPGTGINSVKVSSLKRNWAVPPDAVTVQCKGRTLAEVHICLDKSLSPMTCPEAEKRADNCPGTVNLH
jgi:ribonuclease T2